MGLCLSSTSRTIIITITQLGCRSIPACLACRAFRGASLSFIVILPPHIQALYAKNQHGEKYIIDHPMLALLQSLSKDRVIHSIQDVVANENVIVTVIRHQALSEPIGNRITGRWLLDRPRVVDCVIHFDCFAPFFLYTTGDFVYTLTRRDLLPN
ncbi:unnamed protein product [Trichogramma brassicae]|uniref:Uncharacterized protein n=1 Tax=Trichogramma brassicae TaxID=86971 RepID=A0A6H5IBI3_9HYME|nr:unnamed protein product [Trichogramma brassicae]